MLRTLTQRQLASYGEPLELARGRTSHSSQLTTRLLPPGWSILCLREHPRAAGLGCAAGASNLAWLDRAKTRRVRVRVEAARSC